MKIWTLTELGLLISCSKTVSEPMKKVWRSDRGTQKNEAAFASKDFPGEFKMFARISESFPENFSIGLDYVAPGEKRIPLLRCNGKHDRVNRSEDTAPHCEYHIHLMDAEDLNRGLTRMRGAIVTDKYASFKEALAYFVEWINITGEHREEYFPQTTDLFLGDT